MGHLFIIIVLKIYFLNITQKANKFKNRLLINLIFHSIDLIVKIMRFDEKRLQKLITLLSSLSFIFI